MCSEICKRSHVGVAITCNIAANAPGTVPGMTAVSLGHPRLLAESDRNSSQETWAEWKIYRKLLGGREVEGGSVTEGMGTQQVAWPYFATH